MNRPRLILHQPALSHTESYQHLPHWPQKQAMQVRPRSPNQTKKLLQRNPPKTLQLLRNCVSFTKQDPHTKWVPEVSRTELRWQKRVFKEKQTMFQVHGFRQAFRWKLRSEPTTMWHLPEKNTLPLCTTRQSPQIARIHPQLARKSAGGRNPVGRVLGLSW